MSTPIQISSATRHAPTRCALALSRAGLVALRADGPEKIVVIHVANGAGKSHMAAQLVGTTGATFVRLHAIDTPRTVAAKLCMELLLEPGRTTSESFQRILAELRARPRLIVIDEFNFIAGTRAVHMLRDIHDECDARFCVLGDETLPKRLKSREDNAFASRVILWQKTIDVSIEDAAMLAKVYTPQVTVSDDLLELLRREHDGNCRAIVNALRRLADLARRDCLERVDAKTWRERHGQASESSLRVVR